MLGSAEWHHVAREPASWPTDRRRAVAFPCGEACGAGPGRASGHVPRAFGERAAPPGDDAASRGVAAGGGCRRRRGPQARLHGGGADQRRACGRARIHAPGRDDRQRHAGLLLLESGRGACGHRRRGPRCTSRSESGAFAALGLLRPEHHPDQHRGQRTLAGSGAGAGQRRRSGVDRLHRSAQRSPARPEASGPLPQRPEGDGLPASTPGGSGAQVSLALHQGRAGPTSSSSRHSCVRSR